ncbi:MAG: hypothetical protein U0359_30130 [Byssovorax sp.]
MSPRPRSSTWLLGAPILAAIAVSACRSKSAPTPTTTASAPASATLAAPPASAAPADAGPSRTSPTLADLRARITSAPAWPSGPGVACGDARCPAGQICCQGAEARCMPKARAKECLDAQGTSLGCDESSDCVEGKICCYGVIYEKQARKVWCEAPSVCEIPLSRPGSLPFPGRELCARGSACRDPKLVCVDDDTMPSGGTCLSAVGTVACGDQKVCSADRPWCLWDPATRAAECIPRGPWERLDGVYTCDGPEDCVGMPCSGDSGKSFCSMDATEPFRFAAEVCHRDADCPGPEQREGGKRLRWTCAPISGDVLPGLRECDQIEETPP